MERFRIIPDGIAWDVGWPDGIPHHDHLEMTGRQVSVILRWAVDSRCQLRLVRQIYWPLLRGRHDDVRGHLSREFGDDAEPAILVDGCEERIIALKVKRVTIDGTFTALHHPIRGLELERCVFPATRAPALVERWTLTNRSGKTLRVGLGAVRYERVSHGATGRNRIVVSHDPCEQVLAPGERLVDGFCIAATADAEDPVAPEPAAEEAQRRARVRDLTAVRLLTPEPVLDQLFRFCAIRPGESLVDTPRGPVMTPGGGDFYSGIWANDTLEYTAPWSAHSGDPQAIQAAINAIRLFGEVQPADCSPMPGARENLHQGAVPSHPGGDRGDAAMLLSGAGRFLLGLGDPAAASELWPVLRWAADYCQRKTTTDGVVASDSDELEGRFPTGKANLTTSSLAYDGYRHLTLIAADLGQADEARRWSKAAEALASAIEGHFAAEVGGFPTYRYFAGCTVLRAWLGMPLAVGLHRRAEGTTRALLSDTMLTVEGLRTQQDAPTVWDRATLYALKGMILAGQMAQALPVLRAWAKRRLLGDHVPYPWEFEIGMCHMAGEPPLYNRLVIEGLFGLRFTGLGRAVVEPHLPDAWPEMALLGLCIGAVRHDIRVRRGEAGAVTVEVSARGQAPRVQPAH